MVEFSGELCFIGGGEDPGCYPLRNSTLAFIFDTFTARTHTIWAIALMYLALFPSQLPL